MRDFYVYWFVDSTTGLPFYIGKGHDRPGYDRVYEHEYLARNSKHYNKPLQARIRRGKYTVIKVAQNLSEEDAFCLEGKYITEHGMKHEGGILLNLVSSTAKGGYSWSEERRQAKSERERSLLRGRPVSQYTLTGEFVANFASARIASRCVEANASYIAQVCRGVRKSAGGFQWRYTADGQTPLSYQTERGRVIEQLSKDGELVHTYTTCRLIREAGFNFRLVLDCCRGKSRTSQGFIWRYAD